MGFKQEFDQIMEDLIGKAEEKSSPMQNLKDYWQNDESDYRSKYYFEIEELRRKTDELYRKYEVDTDFINYFCEKFIHKCSCQKEFILYTFLHPEDKARLRTDRLISQMPEMEIADVLTTHRYKTYFCMFCGRPFDVVNGQILRVELKPEDIEIARRERQH